MEDSVGLPVASGFLTVDLGSFKVTIRHVPISERKTDSQVNTKFCAVREKSCVKSGLPKQLDFFGVSGS